MAFSHVVPPKAIERRPRRARVLLQQVQLLDRDEELVAAGVPQLHELGRGLGPDLVDRELAQSYERANAVLDVDDVIADLQVAEIRQKRPRNRPLPPDPVLLLEQIRLRVDLERGVGQSESSRERSGHHQHGRRMRVRSAIERHADQPVLGEQLDDPFGSPIRGRHEELRIAALAAAPHFGDPVAEPAMELNGGLAGDVAHSAVAVVGVGVSVSVGNAEGVEHRGTRKPRRDPIEVDVYLIGRGRHVPSCDRVVVAAGGAARRRGRSWPSCPPVPRP